MNNSNLKDKVTTICGLVFAVSTALLAIDVPPVVKTVCGVLAAVSVALIGYFTGKAPSGAQKTEGQVTEGNIKNP